MCELLQYVSSETTLGMSALSWRGADVSAGFKLRSLCDHALLSFEDTGTQFCYFHLLY